MVPRVGDGEGSGKGLVMFTINVHADAHLDIHYDAPLAEVLNRLAALQTQVEQLGTAIMARFDDVMDEIDAATTEIGEDIDDLQAQLGDLLTPEQKARLEAASTRLKAIAADHTKPVPPPPPPVEPPPA